MTAFDLAALQLGNPIISGKGAKSIPVTYSTVKPVVWLPDAQVVAFEPSNFSDPDASRVNLVMRASPQAIEALTALDEYIVGLCALHSLQIFGKVLSEDEVRARYNPCLKRSEKYADTFKCKINLAGRGQVRLWDAEKQSCGAPVSWVGASVTPKIAFRSLWVMSKEFGCLLDASDVMLDVAACECPF